VSIISNVTVHPIKQPVGKSVAFVRMTIDECLQLNNMRLVNGANGLFISFPNDPSYKGDDYKSIYYPITKAMRDEIETLAINKYNEMTGKDSCVKHDDCPF